MRSRARGGLPGLWVTLRSSLLTFGLEPERLWCCNTASQHSTLQKESHRCCRFTRGLTDKRGQQKRMGDQLSICVKWKYVYNSACLLTIC